MLIQDPRTEKGLWDEAGALPGLWAQLRLREPGVHILQVSATLGQLLLQSINLKQNDLELEMSFQTAGLVVWEGESLGSFPGSSRPTSLFCCSFTWYGAPEKVVGIAQNCLKPEMEAEVLALC